MNIKILSSTNHMLAEFGRLCREYDSLDAAVAWCGDPRKVLPFSHLRNVSGSIRVIMGTAFMQTHPKAIESLMVIAQSVRIVHDNRALFHPKVYRFSKGSDHALIVGSSNFTFSGFCVNTEINVLLEGGASEFRAVGEMQLLSLFRVWQSDAYSFVPNAQWLQEYRGKWESARKAERITGINSPAHDDADVPSGSWLAIADWPTFLDRLQEGLNATDRSIEGYFKVLDDAKQRLATPWQSSTFESIQNRRIIFGTESKAGGVYGWLGHVGASGRFMKMLANGSREQKSAIVQAINEAAAMDALNQDSLAAVLERLVALGPTVKVWGRLLCLVRPDMFCSVSSDSLRRNLAQTLGLPVKELLTVPGYVALISLLHRSPWQNAPQPADQQERRIWQYRVALIDPIFY